MINVYPAMPVDTKINRVRSYGITARTERTKSEFDCIVLIREYDNGTPVYHVTGSKIPPEM
jgi:hypothetical protein